ncbi:hypothetical protein ACERII_02310 [Evansella sp. AB-rgal1]|uniref:YphA family membrane protein n=1 Tax=Evansella sp. AB-rgal1 TaxID=3242696 RepID=UPI00359EFB0A
MDGFWFFWAMWLVVIAIQFFDESSRKQKWIVTCLLIISTSSIVIPFLTISLRMPLIIFAIISFTYIARLDMKNIFYAYILSTLTAAVFLMVNYFIFFEPVWLYVSPLIMVSFLTLFSNIVFMKNQKKRVAILVSGFVQGEGLLVVLLWHQSHPSFSTFIYGDYIVLDMLGMSLFLVLCWNLIENFVEFIKKKWINGKLGPQHSPGKVNV